MNVDIKKIDSGVYLVDAQYMNRQNYAACYIIVEKNEIALIETNTNFAVPKILKALQELHLDKQQVKYIILTHIHLDHAGGAGLLMKEIPNAQLVLHLRGEKHMVVPEKLIESVKTVYGEQEYNKMYGKILPVKQDRILTIQDDTILNLKGRKLYVFETPGHAKHHISVFDRNTKIVFSGDSFGIGYPVFTYKCEQLIFPSTSPTQFDPISAIHSIDKIVGLKPDKICLTHYGVIKDLEYTSKQLKAWIKFLVEKSENLYNSGLRKDRLINALEKLIYSRFSSIINNHRDSYLSEDEKQLIKTDFELNAKGVALYTERKNLKYKN
jgi:glyoxylase-like metal-dependent hydrolase (beta-lactamase superfamily II)